MGVRDFLVGVWFFIGIIIEVHELFLLFQFKQDVLTKFGKYSKIIYTQSTDLWIIAEFLLILVVFMALLLWIQDGIGPKRCAAPIGIFYALLQVTAIVRGPIPFLFFLPLLVVAHLLSQFKSKDPRPSSVLNQQKPSLINISQNIPNSERGVFLDN